MLDEKTLSYMCKGGNGIMYVSKTGCKQRVSGNESVFSPGCHNDYKLTQFVFL
jgi:hypothetical protein